MPDHIVPSHFGAHELSVYAVWFGWIEEFQCYAYQSETGAYFALPNSCWK